MSSSLLVARRAATAIVRCAAASTGRNLRLRPIRTCALLHTSSIIRNSTNNRNRRNNSKNNNNNRQEADESMEHSEDYSLFLPKVYLNINDAQNVEAISRLVDTYRFMVSSFLKESLAFTNMPQANADAAEVSDRIVAQFKREYPNYPVPTRVEVAQYYRVISMLKNEDQHLELLVYEDAPLVDDLKNVWSYLHQESGPEDGVFPPAGTLEEIAKDFEVPVACIEAWFKFFQVLDSIPYIGPYENCLTPKALMGRKSMERFGMMKPFFNEAEQKEYFGSGNDKIIDLNLGTKSILNLFQNNAEPSGGRRKKSESSNKEDSDKKPKNDKNDKNEKEFNFDFNLNPENIGKMAFLTSSFLLGVYMFSMLSLDSNQEVSFQDFTSKFLLKNLVKKLVIINNKTASIELNETGFQNYPNQLFYFNIGSVESFERNLRKVQDDLEIQDQIRVPVVYVSEGNTSKMLINFLPTLLFLGAIYYMTKKAGGMGGMGGPMGFGKSTAKKFNQETDVKIRFKDVAGMSEAKEEVMEFVKFLQNPEKYERLGAKIPRGAILSGPPGTGKTLIAKATAGEAGVPFYSVSGSEFVEMFVGVGALRVRDLFKTARQNAPSIVFVDEIDAIGKQRSKGNASGANDERETTLNQLLVEMDGFDSNDHVVVLAGTNRADILDKALMRPGRFDRHISIDNPELSGRKEIFDVHLKKITMVDNIDEDLSGRLAALTPGFSGADIANVCNESALIAARYNAEAVTLRHFELAIERVIGGVEKKSKLLSGEEQKIVAYHEAGHAVCGWYLKHASPLLKVSIIPRGQGALGYAQYLPPDQYLLNTFQLNDRMIMTLGGRVSEELNFNSVTSGGHDDFKKVTNIAQLMVLRYGMSEKVGFVNYADSRDSDDLTKPFSEETNRIIDEEIQRIVSECYEACRELLTSKSKEVKLVAEELLKKEFITREDMIRLLGKRPFPETNDAFDKYLEGKPAFKNIQPNNESKENDLE